LRGGDLLAADAEIVPASPLQNAGICIDPESGSAVRVAPPDGRRADRFQGMCDWA